MVAKLLVGKSEAILESNGEWSSQDQNLLQVLRSVYNPSLYPTSPSEGTLPHSAQARAAANGLKGRLEWGPSEEGVEGRVY